MTLKEILIDKFGIDLPISGGFGHSIEHPVIIHRTEINDHIDTEYTIFDLLAKSRNADWKLNLQELIYHHDRIIDKLTILIFHSSCGEDHPELEEYYFDITECF